VGVELFKDATDSTIDLSLLSELNSMAENNDFCEVFTDLDNLLTMDAGNLVTSQPVLCEKSTGINDTPNPFPLPTPDVIPGASCSPDHSYSAMVPTATKRKFIEITNYDEDESVSVSSFSDLDQSLRVVKHSKYLERRKKNNMASKRSREIRKNKFLGMDEEAMKLERSNEELKKRIEQLESLTKRMKEALVARLAATQ